MNRDHSASRDFDYTGHDRIRASGMIAGTLARTLEEGRVLDPGNPTLIKDLKPRRATR